MNSDHVLLFQIMYKPYNRLHPLKEPIMLFQGFQKLVKYISSLTISIIFLNSSLELQKVKFSRYTTVALNIERNKEKLGSIIKTILFCGHQNIALREHREGSNSRNPAWKL